MKEYVRDNFPTLLETFVKSCVRYEYSTVGYYYNPTTLNDKYHTETNYYVDKFNVVWITENDDKDRKNAKYLMDGRLETMYNLFGKELFELFFFEVHGINLKNKGTKNWDWIFVEVIENLYF